VWAVGSIRSEEVEAWGISFLTNPSLGGGGKPGETSERDFVRKRQCA